MFGCCTLKTLVKICIFKGKKPKKQEICSKIKKNMFFKFAPKRWSIHLLQVKTVKNSKNTYFDQHLDGQHLNAVRNIQHQPNYLLIAELLNQNNTTNCSLLKRCFFSNSTSCFTSHINYIFVDLIRDDLGDG